MTGTPRILIVGFGSIGRKEYRESRHLVGAKIVGICDTRFGEPGADVPAGIPCFADLNQALHQTHPTLVRIATPPATHASIALQALEYGADVYIEKIMTLSVEEARRVLTSASAVGRKVFVRRNGLYTAVYNEAHARSRALGTVRHVEWIEPTQEYSFWSDSKQTWLRNLPGGIVSEHLPHALYTVRWFLGEEPEVVYARFSDDGLNVLLSTSTATASITYTAPADIPTQLNLVCRDGSVSVNHSTYRVSAPRGNEGSRTPERRLVKSMAQEASAIAAHIPRMGALYVRRSLGFAPQSLYGRSDNFRQLNDIVTGGFRYQSFAQDGEEGLRNVQLFESIWRRAIGWSPAG